LIAYSFLWGTNEMKIFQNNKGSILLLLFALFFLFIACIALLTTSTLSFDNQGYAKFELPDQRLIWMQIGEEGFRSAESLEALEAAAWQSSQNPGTYNTLFPAIELPLDKESFTGLKKADLTMSSRARARLSYEILDEKGDTWEYLLSGYLSTAEDPNLAPTYNMPDLAKPKLDFDAKPESSAGQNLLKIALTITLEDEVWDLDQITKNGKPQRATIKVTDDKGKVVSSAKKELSDLGYT